MAAEFIKNRCGVEIKHHTKPIQEFPKEFYENFHVIIAGLDNIEARRWINSMVHSMVEFDSEGNPKEET